jgi:hypothetical protein
VLKVRLGDRLLAVGNEVGSLAKVSTSLYQEVVKEVRASVQGWEKAGMLYMEFAREVKRDTEREPDVDVAAAGKALFAAGNEDTEGDGSGSDEPDKAPVDAASLASLQSILREPSELARLLQFVRRAHKQQLLFVLEVDQLAERATSMGAAAVLETASKILRVFFDLGEIGIASNIDDWESTEYLKTCVSDCLRRRTRQELRDLHARLDEGDSVDVSTSAYDALATEMLTALQSAEVRPVLPVLPPHIISSFVAFPKHSLALRPSGERASTFSKRLYEHLR